MVTDEQRHEVAEKLRAISDEEGKWRTVAMRWLAVQVKPSELADLIEPSEPVVFQCAHCGGVWHKQPVYCPCCGKKVE